MKEKSGLFFFTLPYERNFLSTLEPTTAWNERWSHWFLKLYKMNLKNKTDFYIFCDTESESEWIINIEVQKIIKDML